LGQRTDDQRIAFGHHGGFAEGPAQIRIAELGAAQGELYTLLPLN